jgi:hypothetical protein
VDELETAASALGGQFDTFADLLQRDIDWDRVNTIVEDYLTNTSPGARFFPPLLVSLLPLETQSDGGAPKVSDQYHAVDAAIDGNWLKKTWDGNKFRIELRLTDSPDDLPIRVADTERHVVPFGCTLRWNSKRVKLIVIDGQHRLSALQQLYRDTEKRKFVAEMDLPMCVVFPPNAVNNNVRGEKIREILRDLFITVNKTPKTVSGHFLVLLDDQSIASIAVRSFAERWKATPLSLSSNLTYLHLLEWNQRLKSRSNQIERTYSISTVSIIATELEKSLFSSDSSICSTAFFLNLASRKKEFEKNKDWETVDSITHRVYHLEQREIIAQQVDKFVTPSLVVLFTQPSPYGRRIELLDQAKDWLDERVAENRAGARTFRDECLYRYQTPGSRYGGSVIDVANEFEAKCAGPDDDEVFFQNVFQHGFIRAWIEIAKDGLLLEIPPDVTASALVRAMESFVFAPAVKYFSGDALYLNLSVLRDGGRYIVTDTARNQWKRLILIGFLNESIRTAFSCEVTKSRPLTDLSLLQSRLHEKASAELAAFQEDLQEATYRDFARNWASRGISESQRVEILRLKGLGEGGVEHVRKYIEDTLAAPAVAKAIKRLTSRINGVTAQSA